MIATAAQAKGGEQWRPCRQSVQWNESVGAAQRMMRVAGLESVMVIGDNQPIGRITRRDIERCLNQGNWLEAVMVRDLVGDAHDTCN